MSLSPSQKRAINRVNHFIESYVLQDSSVEKYGQKVTKFEVEDFCKYFATIDVEVDYTGLPDTNYLRYISKQNLMFSIGKRGKISVRVYSQDASFKQFAGKKAFGIHFRK